MKRKKIKKKGSMLDLMYLVPLLFVTILILFFVNKAWSEMSPQLQQEDFLDNNESLEAFTQVDNTIDGFNLLIPFVFIMGVIIIMILAYTVDVTPMFVIIGIVIFAVILTLSVMFANIFDEIAEEPDLSAQVTTYAAPVFIMQKLPIIIGIVGLLILIAVYAKYRSGGGSGI